MRMFLRGNDAAAYGARLSRPKLIAAYPITPQSPIYEKLSEWDARDTLGARMMRVESEHSAMAACISASLTGVRTFTATSSQGLTLMHELLHYASGMRVPVVMANVNRALEFLERADRQSVAARHRLASILCGRQPGDPGYGDPGL